MVGVQAHELAAGEQPHRRIADAQPGELPTVVVRRDHGAAHAVKPGIVPRLHAQTASRFLKACLEPRAGRAVQFREAAREHLNDGAARLRSARLAAHAVGEHQEHRGRLAVSGKRALEGAEIVLLVRPRALPLAAGDRPAVADGGSRSRDAPAIYPISASCQSKSGPQNGTKRNVVPPMENSCMASRAAGTSTGSSPR